MALGLGGGAICSVALFRLGSRSASWPLPKLEGRMVAVAPTLAAVPPNLAVNTDAHRRGLAPWWSPVTLVR
jgi:hypothetical protein